MKKRFLKYCFTALSLLFIMNIVDGNNLIAKTTNSQSIISESQVTLIQIDTDHSLKTDKTIYQSAIPPKQFFEYACFACNTACLIPMAQSTYGLGEEKLQV